MKEVGYVLIRGGNRAGRAGLGWANSGPGQNRTGPKLTRFFRAKILTAQPALKTGPIGPNSFCKAKKIRAGRAGPGHTGPGQIWPGFFRANNLREILFAPHDFLYTPHITHTLYLHPISSMGCIEKTMGCE